MADIQTLKDEIKSTIYPNGKGAINATNHQALLLKMADGMAEADTKLTELSAEITSQIFEPGNISWDGSEVSSEVVSRTNYIPCKAGDVFKGKIYRVHKYDELFQYLGEEIGSELGFDVVEFTLADSSCKYVRLVSRTLELDYVTINGNSLVYHAEKSSAGNSKKLNDLEKTDEALSARIEELSNQISGSPSVSSSEITGLFYESGTISWDGSEVSSEVVSRTNYIPCKAGDVFKGKIYRVHKYDELFQYLGEEIGSELGFDVVEFTLADSSCKYVRLVSRTLELDYVTINGNSLVYHAEKSSAGNSKKLNDLEKDVKSLGELEWKLLNAMSYDISAYGGGWLYQSLPQLERGQKYTISLHSKEPLGTPVYWNVKVGDKFLLIDQVFNQGQTDSAVKTIIADDDYTNAVLGMYADAARPAITANFSLTKVELNSEPLLTMPIPELAKVNFITELLPTTKTDDIHAVMEFDDGYGKVFRKNVVMNAQGTSSLGLPKKNFSIDIVDESFDESHSIKFGDWVVQDGFHIKSYMLDGVRVKPMAAYDFYESILRTRKERNNRVWKRLQLPANIPGNSNSITDVYLQLDNGAKCHPSGFPVIVNVNGEFYGIYCWQLKKHRDNYHQKKDNADHIHLDGYLSNIMLWGAGGTIDWDKWAGKKAESEETHNFEGIEIRNPKKLILTDGSEYDADTNTGELIGYNSPRYDSSNANMVRTAAVRQSIESLSQRTTAMSQMSKGEAKKTELANIFDIDSMIDYVIFSQVTANTDGFVKNWQWVTYDGQKWGVNAYDLDGVWGWTSWAYLTPLTWWFTNDSIPIVALIENYEQEIKERYAELRRLGVIETAHIMESLVRYVQVIGEDYYKQEFSKWPDGARDNLWRFEVWMDESIASTDKLMGYVA